jgi:hypothetical protein
MQTRNKTETKIKISLKTGLDPSDKIEVGERILEFIRDRTLAGNNVRGNPWKGVAGEYVESYAKVKGKSSPVDLELSGDMLANMQQFRSNRKKKEIEIGFKKGSKDEQKALGNILGTYGQPNPIRGKARPFLDILQKDVDMIVSDYTKEKGLPKKKVKTRTLKQDVNQIGVFTF